MTDASSPAAAAELWSQLMFPWVSMAPRPLTQPINPGWTFGNVVVNAQNSSAPQTEQAILAQESYGRQIGKLLDAVCALIETRPGGAAGVAAFQDIEALKAKVERIKREAAAQRIDQLRRDLELLKSSDRTAFETAAAALRTLL